MPIGRPHRAASARTPDEPRDLAVGGGAPKRNVRNYVPNVLLEGAAAEIERKLGIAASTAIATSSLSQEGIDELRKRVERCGDADEGTP